MTSTSFTCTICNIIFRNRTDLNFHVKHIHQSLIKIKFQNGDVVEVKRAEDNTFKCKKKTFSIPTKGPEKEQNAPQHQNQLDPRPCKGRKRLLQALLHKPTSKMPTATRSFQPLSGGEKFSHTTTPRPSKATMAPTAPTKSRNGKKPDSNDNKTTAPSVHPQQAVDTHAPTFGKTPHSRYPPYHPTGQDLYRPTERALPLNRTRPRPPNRRRPSSLNRTKPPPPNRTRTRPRAQTSPPSPRQRHQKPP